MYLHNNAFSCILVVFLINIHVLNHHCRVSQNMTPAKVTLAIEQCHRLSKEKCFYPFFTFIKMYYNTFIIAKLKTLL